MLRRSGFRPSFSFSPFAVDLPVRSHAPSRECFFQAREDAKRLKATRRSISHTGDFRPSDPKMNSSDHSRGGEHESTDYASQDDDVNSRSNWRPFHGCRQPQPGVNPQVDGNAPQQTPQPVSQQNTTGGAPRRSRRPRKARRGTGSVNTPPISQDPSLPMPHSATPEASLPFGAQIALPSGSSNFAFGATSMSVPTLGTYPTASNALVSAFQNPFLQPQLLPWNFVQPGNLPSNPLFWNSAIQQRSFTSTSTSSSQVNTSKNQTEVSGRVTRGSGNNGRSPKKSPPPPIAPVPTKEYLEQAAKNPKKLPVAQPLLVILDLNGTLLYRKKRTFPPSFVKRPGLDNFLKELFTRYTVMVWSSSQPATVEAICSKIFSSFHRRGLVAQWARDKLGLTDAQYKEKVQVYKRLEQVWADESIQARYPTSKRKLGAKMHQLLTERQQKSTSSEDGQTGENDDTVVPPSNFRWDQSNTVLIDDSKLKAAGQPYNILEVPEFTNDPTVDESQVLITVLKRLRKLARTNDVSRMIRHWQNTNHSTITRDKKVSNENESDVSSDAGATTTSTDSEKQQSESKSEPKPEPKPKSKSESKSESDVGGAEEEPEDLPKKELKALSIEDAPGEPKRRPRITLTTRRKIKKVKKRSRRIAKITVREAEKAQEQVRVAQDRARRAQERARREQTPAAQERVKQAQDRVRIAQALARRAQRRAKKAEKQAQRAEKWVEKARTQLRGKRSGEEQQTASCLSSSLPSVEGEREKQEVGL
ncbi:hypothetical protein VTN77DRAFT_7162 [Rasamsonia byssochlamydoides]|uniref:uncharacterized protein n=1 Tax=Rasamsonia byssochlamydoides TaxID=89139 RepID=UPI003742F883